MTKCLEIRPISPSGSEILKPPSVHAYIHTNVDQSLIIRRHVSMLYFTCTRINIWQYVHMYPSVIIRIHVSMLYFTCTRIIIPLCAQLTAFLSCVPCVHTSRLWFYLAVLISSLSVMNFSRFAPRWGPTQPTTISANPLCLRWFRKMEKSLGSPPRLKQLKYNYIFFLESGCWPVRVDVEGDARKPLGWRR